MQELTILAIPENLPQVLEFIDRNLETTGCGATEKM